MSEMIYLPNAEQAAQLIENAWQDFCDQAAENDLDFVGTEAEPPIRDVFVSGYCFGHNDCLSVISGQLEVMNM